MAIMRYYLEWTIFPQPKSNESFIAISALKRSADIVMIMS